MRNQKLVYPPQEAFVPDQWVNVLYVLLQATVLALEKRIDHMEWKADMMNKNMDDMNNSNKMMTRSMAKTQVIIDKLQ